MSEYTDNDRREGAREAAGFRFDSLNRLVLRLKELWMQGRTDREIAIAFGWTPGSTRSREGWSPKTVARWRKRYGLTIGNGRDQSFGGTWRTL